MRFFEVKVNIKGENILTWLEKQDEQKPYGQREECLVCQFNYAGECKGFCAMKRDEQKPQRIISVEAKETSFDYENANIQQKDFAPKIKPKVKVGDWLVENGVNKNTVQIKSFEEDKGVGIKVWFSNGTGTYIDFLKGYHKWTIQDAKDGDVLVASDGSIFLFGGVDDSACKYYAALTADNYIKINKEAKGDYWETLRAVYPATKEQRDLLFRKMKEEGYEWDANKKELKKIEQKPWSEEDEITRNALINLVEMYYGSYINKSEKSRLLSWLKSLRPQNTWKPNEEQMDALETAVSSIQSNTLETLYQDLKKLKG